MKMAARRQMMMMMMIMVMMAMVAVMTKRTDHEGGSGDGEDGDSVRAIRHRQHRHLTASHPSSSFHVSPAVPPWPTSLSSPSSPWSAIPLSPHPIVPYSSLTYLILQALSPKLLTLNPRLLTVYPKFLNPKSMDSSCSTCSASAGAHPCPGTCIFPHASGSPSLRGLRLSVLG